MKEELKEEFKAEVFRACEILKAGGLILYPTDTVWGIGCDATNAEAVDKIYKLKQSNSKTSMIILTESLNKVMLYVDHAPHVAFDLIEMADKPLTLILEGAKTVAANLVPEEGTIGIRVVKHEFCEALLKRFGRPLVSTSANISGEPTPLKASEISKLISSGVDMVVNPAFEGVMTRKPSSIVALGQGGQVKIIRE